MRAEDNMSGEVAASSAARCPAAEETLVSVPAKPSKLRKACSPLTLRALRTLRLGVKPLVVP